MVLLEAVALDLALGAMLGSDEASLVGSGLRFSGCNPVFCAPLGGTGEGDRDELNFERSLLYPFLIDFRMTRMEDETSWESGKELKQDHYDVPCSTRGGL